MSGGRQQEKKPGQASCCEYDGCSQEVVEEGSAGKERAQGSGSMAEWTIGGT